MIMEIFIYWKLTKIYFFQIFINGIFFMQENLSHLTKQNLAKFYLNCKASTIPERGSFSICI